MRRKRLTKKANKTPVKAKRQVKMTSLTVAETLKQLPKQFKKELTLLKKQARELTAALNKTKKQKNKVQITLNKKSASGKTSTAVKKAYHKISQTIARLTIQLEATHNSITFLSQKQAAFIALSKPIAKKPENKSKKAKSIAKPQKKLLKPLAPAVTSMNENTKTSMSNEPTTTISRLEPEEEVEMNS